MDTRTDDDNWAEEYFEQVSDLMLYMINEKIERKKIEKNLEKTRGWVMINKTKY